MGFTLQLKSLGPSSALRVERARSSRCILPSVGRPVSEVVRERIIFKGDHILPPVLKGGGEVGRSYDIRSSGVGSNIDQAALTVEGALLTVPSVWPQPAYLQGCPRMVLVRFGRHRPAAPRIAWLGRRARVEGFERAGAVREAVELCVP